MALPFVFGAGEFLLLCRYENQLSLVSLVWNTSQLRLIVGREKKEKLSFGKNGEKVYPDYREAPA